MMKANNEQQLTEATHNDRKDLLFFVLNIKYRDICIYLFIVWFFFLPLQKIGCGTNQVSPSFSIFSFLLWIFFLSLLHICYVIKYSFFHTFRLFGVGCVCVCVSPFFQVFIWSYIQKLWPVCVLCTFPFKHIGSMYFT